MICMLCITQGLHKRCYEKISHRSYDNAQVIMIMYNDSTWPLEFVRHRRVSRPAIVA
jgi:hypothetical protein